MASSSENILTPRQLLRILLSSLSLENLIHLFDILRFLRQLWQQSSSDGLYELLDFNLQLELVDTEGKTAVLHKWLNVKFKQDNAHFFFDYGFGDGHIFAESAYQPGQVVTKYKEGDRWVNVLWFRHPKNRGDVVPFYGWRVDKNTYTQNEEAFQIEIRNPTEHLKTTIFFPAGRPCQEAVLIERNRHRTTPLGPEHFINLPDGRQVLIWETRSVHPLEVFTISWKW